MRIKLATPLNTNYVISGVANNINKTFLTPVSKYA